MFTKQNYIVFFLLTAIGFFAYKDCLAIFIPGDHYSQLFFAEQGFMAGFTESARSGAPYFVGYPLLYFCYQVFGASPAGWLIASVLLHVMNAFLVFLLAKQLVKLFWGRQETVVAFFSSLIFLISPYQTENVIWVAITLRLPFHAFVTLAGLYFFIRFLSFPSVKKLVIIHVLFLLGIFTSEFTLICPLIYIVFFLLFRMTNKTGIPAKRFLIQLFFIQLVFIAVFFVAGKAWSGYWFWHGGTAGNIVQTTDYAKTFLKYLAKFFLFYRYLPLAHADGFARDIFSSFYTRAVLLFVTGAVFVFIFRKWIKNNKENGYFLFAMFTCFAIALLPVLPLDSSFLKYIYPDRYGYLASAFFYIFLASTLVVFLKKFAFPVLAGYCVLCWVLLMQTTTAWSSANDYCNKLVQNYKPFLQYDNVFVLNVPSYYKGVAAFRSAFSETIYMRYNKSPVEKIHVIAGTYQESWTDTLMSVKKSGNAIQVTGPEKRTPHFCIGGWAKSYETKEYHVIFDSTGCSYLLSFKQGIPPNSAILYTSNGTWKKVE